jgi:NAD+ kinase
MGVLANREHADLDDVLARLSRAAEKLGFRLYAESELEERCERSVAPLEESWHDIDWLLTLGGDGTLLRGAREAGPRGLPVLGVNLGRLGFLTMVAQEDMEGALERVAQDDYAEEERLTLDVRLRRGGGRDGEASFYALNDAVIHKSGFARLIALRLWAGDDEVGQYSADGIILATPTGSTAYSLSAGGPILVPAMDGIMAVPISPHTLAIRPVVVPGRTRLRVELLSEVEEIALTIDGQTGSHLRAGDQVEVERSDSPLRLMCFPGHSFFAVMRRKLRWGDVRPLDRGKAE